MKRKLGYNEFLGEVQHRLINMGYMPPVWPDPSIRDMGDMDEALDCCTEWCANRLDEIELLKEKISRLEAKLA